MADQTWTSWSDNPYAPQIPYGLYFTEKVSFSGAHVGAIVYGILLVLFFQCMGSLLNPPDRTRGGIKWALVAHTILMFSFATIYTVGAIAPSGYIDEREFPGNDESPPGPFGYELSLYAQPVSALPNSMFYPNQWLADGLLLYRCYIIYATNYWAIAFPFLMYLVTLGMGILIIYETWRPLLSAQILVADNFIIPYYSISLSLNAILTLMIVIRLALHSKSLRDAMGPLSRPDRLYTSIITILVESSALYAVNFLVYVGPWSAQNSVTDFFLPLLSQTQVIAPFLITLRVANRTALTTESITTKNINIGPLHFASQRKSSGQETLPEWHSMTTVDDSGDASSKHGVGVESDVDEIRYD